jgi:S-(hydroxymethyl)glutathione dehydrogenase/alcohol dehydrogenase
MFEGKTITCRAAVVWAVGEKPKIEQIQVDPPRKGEARIKIIATGICRKFK